MVEISPAFSAVRRRREARFPNEPGFTALFARMITWTT